MSELIFKWAGLVLVYMISIALLACALESLFKALQGYFDRIIYRIESNAVRQLAGKMLRDSWWFSEDATTMMLLQAMGRELADRASYDVSEMRDAWRKNRENIARANQEPTP